MTQKTSSEKKKKNKAKQTAPRCMEPVPPITAGTPQWTPGAWQHFLSWRYGALTPWNWRKFLCLISEWICHSSRVFGCCLKVMENFQTRGRKWKRASGEVAAALRPAAPPMAPSSLRRATGNPSHGARGRSQTPRQGSVGGLSLRVGRRCAQKALSLSAIYRSKWQTGGRRCCSSTWPAGVIVYGCVAGRDQPAHRRGSAVGGTSPLCKRIQATDQMRAVGRVLGPLETALGENNQ